MLWCWWCCHDFDNEPLKLPLKYDDRRKRYVTSGRFCSWSCMKTYALEQFGLSRGGIICGNMVMMRRQLFGKRGSIQCAPKRQTLLEFGGTHTIEQFRANVVIDDEPRGEIVEEPDVELTIPPVKNVAKLYEIKGTVGTNEPLRLKREKPLKRDQNNLESVLGLVIKPKA